MNIERSELRDMTEAAIMHERERCAKIADRIRDEQWALYKTGNGADRGNPYVEGASDMADIIALEIRKGEPNG